MSGEASHKNLLLNKDQVVIRLGIYFSKLGPWHNMSELCLRA